MNTAIERQQSLQLAVHDREGLVGIVHNGVIVVRSGEQNVEDASSVVAHFFAGVVWPWHLSKLVALCRNDGEPIDFDVVIAIWSLMFVRQTQCMEQFVNDDAVVFFETDFAKQQLLRPAHTANVFVGAPIRPVRVEWWRWRWR